ncbi:hypothetical protein PGT21_026457 [Puccinia graminis f. sp. tritici]|uniref:Uncharacterized protein n=1 Tax=Puccinia graminis f. sp. tritici TaxID=56615 RepID=A0A5B0R1M0_PUCGR|nr:hypothetical protein PGT21_026457 [Puccinia graminis f. sp. tritici]
MACSTIRLTLTDPLAQQYRKVKPVLSSKVVAADDLLSIEELSTDCQIADRLVGGLDPSWSAVRDSVGNYT